MSRYFRWLPAVLLVAAICISAVNVVSARPAARSHPHQPPKAPAGTLQHHVVVPHLGQLRYLVHRPPARLAPGQKLPVVILLHGLGGFPENWLVDANVGVLLNRAVQSGKLPPCLVVIPQGDSGYWADWRDKRHPWAKWLNQHLLADVAKRYPIRQGRGAMAIVGASMGGYGATSAALTHPERFGFVVALSGTDVQIATDAQPHHRWYTRVWGDPIDATALKRVNPLQMVQRGQARPWQRYLLGWGSREASKFALGGKRLAAALRKRGIPVQTRVVRGKGHGWANAWAPLQGWWIAALGRWLRSTKPTLTKATPTKRRATGKAGR
ncbi:MAG: prolyl oligopeptidase family serine peptidase [Myxococcales bacterium]|nr:prolyl oligopeptidase family serine peptidase [Myxococcales bacterium]